jgi:predicted aspartyl protease
MPKMRRRSSGRGSELCARDSARYPAWRMTEAPEASETTVVVIPAEHEGKVLVVKASLADGPQARLVIDTGAGKSALSSACADRLRLPVHRGLRVRTPTGLTAVGTLRIPHLRVGSLEVGQMLFAVVPLPNDRVDGLLGLDFFRALGAVSVTICLDGPHIQVTLPSRARMSEDQRSS